MSSMFIVPYECVLPLDVVTGLTFYQHSQPEKKASRHVDHRYLINGSTLLDTYSHARQQISPIAVARYVIHLLREIVSSTNASLTTSLTNKLCLLTSASLPASVCSLHRLQEKFSTVYSLPYSVCIADGSI